MDPPERGLTSDVWHLAAIGIERPSTVTGAAEGEGVPGGGMDDLRERRVVHPGVRE